MPADHHRPALTFDAVASLTRDSRLLAFESHWNLGSPSGFGPTSATTMGGSLPVQLECRSLHYSTCVGSGPDPPFWPDLRSARDFTFFPVVFHPTVNPPGASDAVHLLPDVTGVPTASQRTFAILDGDEESRILGYAKLHYPGVIGRFDRSLTLYQWMHSLEVARILMSERSNWPEHFTLMPEYGGTYVEASGQTAGFGTLYRGNPMSREGEISDSTWVVPAFSLLGNEEANFESLPLLDFLLGLLGNNRDECFAELTRLIISAYIWMACETGLIPEFNAQNVLIVGDPGRRQVSVCVRDMADVFQDLDILPLARGPFSRYKTIGATVSNDLYQRRSFAYDFKLGSYVLAPLCRVYAQLAGVGVESIMEVVRGVGRDSLAPHVGYFESSEQWWAYPPVEGVGRADYVSLDGPAFR